MSGKSSTPKGVKSTAKATGPKKAPLKAVKKPTGAGLVALQGQAAKVSNLFYKAYNRAREDQYSLNAPTTSWYKFTPAESRLFYTLFKDACAFRESLSNLVQVNNTIYRAETK